MLGIGMPGSPARWLSENVETLPAEHDFVLMEWKNGQGGPVTTGTKKHCQSMATDLTKQVVCDLRQYRKGE